ncbi:MFS transporter [Penicillium subrubescens]|uniref:MFS transporter n=1 Tax=Penicillium subrubescens TaxID=1316194 RepID=UPI002544DF09|nr:MFS transporter [Penicillium subrubescens]KAJ5906392.1 MFS transporter [Penicillium subrubescens]
MSSSIRKPWGYRWRSSTFFILSCVALALFSENFLYSFIVPILPTILEDRLHIDPSKAQVNTSAVLSIHALVCFLSGLPIGSWADRNASRKGPLLLSLGGEIAGTIIVATATSLPVLFLGRIIQAIAGNAAWIIGFATVTDTVAAEHRSRAISVISVFFISGLLVGPMVSGIFMKLIGYWPTWLIAIAILVIDMIMRLGMIESPAGLKKDVDGSRSDSNPSDETSTLISRSRSSTGEFRQEETLQQNANTGLYSTETATESSNQNFYKVMLSNPQALTAMACHGVNALTLVSFDATLPLHVTRAFGWDTSRISLMFLLLQLPTMFLSPLTGWMKDRVGTNGPASIGFLATAFFLWILGTAGPDGLSFVGSREKGQAVYISSMLGLGIVRSLLTGCGVIEMTSVVTKLQETQPAIFGPNGGFSRAYSLTNMSWTFGMLIGPILAGSLNQTVGYYHMNICLAIICSICAILTFLYFHRK